MEIDASSQDVTEESIFLK